MKKEMLINVLQPEECRIAILEDGVLEELYVERTSHESYTGNIYKGKVVNLEPAIQAAFVDFSVGRNGFLHVSDVEPQYYRRFLDEESELGARDRHREPRRERDEPRSRSSEERGHRAGSPPAIEPAEERPRERERDRELSERERPERERPERERPERERPERERPERERAEWERPDWERPDWERPDRERPDRSERGRRDRSTPRRFGEGLTEEEEEWSPPPPPEPVHPSEPPTELEAGPSDLISQVPTWPEHERPTPEPPPSRRERGQRSAEPFDPDLPPSRTGRSSFGSFPSSPISTSGAGEEPPGLSWSVDDLREAAPEPSPPPEPSPSPAPRRGRGRGRAARAGDEAEFTFEPEDVLGKAEPEAEEPRVEKPASSPPRRRGGRAAIRSRGGEREYERPQAQEPSAERERPAPAEPPPAASEPTRPQPRSRSREKPRDRAGEPGYVPRRERTRLPEHSFDTGAEPLRGWGDLDTEPAAERAGQSADSAPESTDLGREGDKEGARRRRRRRGRRRERPERETSASAAAEELLGKPGEPFDSPRHGSRPGAMEMESIDDEFEFDESPSDDAIVTEEARTGRGAADIDDQIDPELEEEIRKEIEEIAELEREMGLRGPIEARPRRADERAPDAARGGPRAARGRGLAKPPIQEIFRRGDEVLVQVIKESIGTKGPTLSTYISIPGRYLVLMPGLNRVGVSRKIADEGQRRKLREIMNELNPPKGLGFIVRTAGLERSKRELARDLAYLLRLWKVILRRIKKAKAPAPIYQESDMITRTIRDIFTSEIDTIWIDEPQAFERAQEFLRVVMPRFVNRLKFYDEKVPLFHKYGIEEEISKIQRRHIPLPEGGSIVIDQTEALVAIDVNSGNFRVENDAERTAYEMNLRAAKEIARQLRLRDLGGVIVNDFIDMREERNRRGVERALREAIKRDRARTKVLRMSAFGIIEMTRQRIRPSLRRSVYEDCVHCTGAGVVKTAESMAIDVMRLLALAAHREDIRRVNVSVCAAVSNYLNNRKRREVARLENEARMTIHIRHEEDVPGEHLQIDCYDGQNNEVRLMPAPPPTASRRGR